MRGGHGKGRELSTALSPEAVAAWRRDGFHFPLDILTEREAAAFRGKLEAHEALSGSLIDGPRAHRSHTLFTWVQDIIRHPSLLDAVEGLIGPDILCWNSHFFIKPAGDPRYVSWHQDTTYFGLSPPELVTAWIAITPATRESGCLKIVPGTHKRAETHEDTFARDNMLTRGQRIASGVDERNAVPVELRAGQASLHHGLLVHGSEPNRSGERRIGLAIRYIPTRVRQTVGHRDWATLVRGEDAFGHFEPDHRPLRDLEPDALRFHRAAAEAQLSVLYQGLAGAPPPARPG